MTSRILTSAAVLATLSLAVTPAFAGQHGSGHSRGSSGSRESSRGSAPRGSSAPRTSAPSRSYSAGAPRGDSQSRGGFSGQSRGGYSGQSRGGYAGQSRGVYSGQSRGFYSGQSRGFYEGRRGFGSRGVFVAPSHFYRPYYTFRPRFSLGFGLWAGYPIAYPYPYYYGYGYGYPYAYDSYADPGYYPPPAYGYGNPSSAYPPANNYPQYDQRSSGQSGRYESDAPRESVTAQPGTASGGISFEISPATAEVEIDGAYVGLVSELGPTSQPLGLTPGRHHVVVRADGYQTLSIDADVIAGQVVPYQGTMQPAR
jgi:PEGA domain